MKEKFELLELLVDYTGSKGILVLGFNKEPIGVLWTALPLGAAGKYDWKNKIFNGVLSLKVENIPIRIPQLTESKFAGVIKASETFKTVKAEKAPELSTATVDEKGNVEDVKKESLQSYSGTTTFEADETGFKHNDPFATYPNCAINKLNELADTDISKAYFIGGFIKNQKGTDKGEYAVFCTPHPDHTKQKVVVFNTERTALFVYSALLGHPDYKSIIESMAPYPVASIAEESSKDICIFVKNGLNFIRNIV